jgi:hypothetical protein
MASSSKAAPKRPARHESKIRYSHELYDALDRYSRSHGGASFQRIVEEALRMFFEGTRKPAAQTRAIARLVLDEIAAIRLAPNSYGRRLNALEEQLSKYLTDGERVERAEDPVDPVLAYVARIAEEPRNEAEAALAAYLRALAER